MNLKRQYLAGLLLIAAFAIILVITCGGDKVTNPVSFSPGKYKGMYKVTINVPAAMSAVFVDTMEFRFGTNDTMYTDYSPDDVDHNACPVRGEYFLKNDSLGIVVDMPNRLNENCNPDLSPQAQYYYMVQGDVIIFRTSSSADTARYIELWNKIN